MTASKPDHGLDPTALPTPTRSMKPLSARTVTMVAAVVVLLTCGAIAGLLWWVGASGVTGTELTRARIEAIKIGLSIAVGGGGVFALYLAWRRQRSNEADHQQRESVLEHQRQVARDSSHDALERRITDLYTKAADQLGSDKAPVRLAGLYALERLAQNNPDQRQTIVDVLCAYLRMPYEVTDGQERIEDNPGEVEVETGGNDTGAISNVEREQERHVRLTAQRLLTKHLRQIGNGETFWAEISLDLDGATLLDFDLGVCGVRYASFDGARFHGPTSFVKTRFADQASFRSAWFGDDIKFDGMQCSGVLFNDAHFCKGVKLDMAKLGWAEFTGTQFAGSATFNGATFDANVDFTWAKFDRHAQFCRAQFNNGASFDDVEFADTAEFDRARFNSGVGFARATFGKSAVFGKTEFADEAYFNLTAFKGDALFSASTFHGSVNFGDALFSKYALFRDVQFLCDVWVHAYARVDVSRGDAKRIWPDGWVLVEPKTPEQGHLPSREGLWGELIDSALFKKPAERDPAH